MHARRQLLALAAALGFPPCGFDLRSNPAGIAVSGEVTLHADRLYVQAGQPATGHDTGILFRSCDGRRDYVGGRNNFASLVDFRTDADYAIRQLRARAPQEALKKALAFNDRHPEDLLFQSYDGGHPVNEIEVFDRAGASVAVWRDDDLRLRLAARDLLDAGELALRELRGFFSDGESEAVRTLAAAVARAKGAQP